MENLLDLLFQFPTCYISPIGGQDTPSADAFQWGITLPARRGTSAAIITTSMLFELLEWATSMTFGGDLGQTYLDTQGDEWGAHKNMALDPRDLVPRLERDAGARTRLRDPAARRAEHRSSPGSHRQRAQRQGRGDPLQPGAPEKPWSGSRRLAGQAELDLEPADHGSRRALEELAFQPGYLFLSPIAPIDRLAT